MARAAWTPFFLIGLLLLSACGGTVESVSGTAIAPTPAPGPTPTPTPTPAPIPTPTPAPPPTYSASVSWTVPSFNTDGSALTDVSGYRVYYGTSPSNLAQSILVAGVGLTSVAVTGLPAGTYYFAVATVNSTGQTSVLSAVVSRNFP